MPKKKAPMDTLTRDGKRLVAYFPQALYTALRERAFDDRVTVSGKLRQIVRSALMEGEQDGEAEKKRGRRPAATEGMV